MQRWMQNPRFPSDGAGSDLLFASGLVTLERGGMFFVPPYDRSFIGSRLFDPAAAWRRQVRLGADSGADRCHIGHSNASKELPRLL